LDATWKNDPSEPSGLIAALSRVASGVAIALDPPMTYTMLPITTLV